MKGSLLRAKRWRDVLITSRSGPTIIVNRWRPWWLPFATRGTVTISDVPGLHQLTPHLAHRLSDYDLHLFPRVRSGDGVARSIVDAEIRRRERSTARWALAISFTALVLSVVTFL